MDKPTSRRWADVRGIVDKRIEEDWAAAYAEFVQELQRSDDRPGTVLRFLSESFEIGARYHLFLIVGYAEIELWYEPYLQELKGSIMQNAEKAVASWPTATAQSLRENLTVHLLGRLHYWKAEAMKRARTREKSAQAESAKIPENRVEFPPEIESDQSVQEADTEAGGMSRIEQCKKLLADYKQATGNPSNKQIYEALNSGIHKPDFYTWRKGELSPKSVMSISFERFLRARKPPLPKHPKQ
jgi:hypothetical protein